MQSWTVYAVPMPLDEAVAFYEERLGSPVERTADEVVFELTEHGQSARDRLGSLHTLRIRRDRHLTSSGQNGGTLLRYVDRYPCPDQAEGESSTAAHHPSRTDVQAKLEAVREAVHGCAGGQPGAVVATIRFEGSSGRVLEVEVSGDFAGAAAACVADVIRGVILTPFPESSISVNYTYRFQPPPTASPDDGPPADRRQARTDVPDDDAEDLLCWGRQLSLRAWTGLVDADCDLETFGIWTPIEARILRHAPLVLHGHAVESADLRTFFEHDGVVARSPDGAAEPLSEAERTCMDRLRQRERALRARMPVPSEAEPLFTTPCAFWAWRGWAYLGDPPDGPYAKTRRWDFFGPEPGGGWRWQATLPDPACTSGAEECGGYVIIAYPDGTCEAVAAG